MTLDQQIEKIFNELYPTGRAWGYARGGDNGKSALDVFTDGVEEAFVDGIGEAFTTGKSLSIGDGKKIQNARIRAYARVYNDLALILKQRIPDNDEFNETDAENWERVYGLGAYRSSVFENRIKAIKTRMSHPNGIFPRQNKQFIQEYLRSMGFMVWVHENRNYNGVDGFAPSVISPQVLNEGVFNVMYFGGTDLSYTEIVKDYIDSDLDSEINITSEDLGVFTFFITGENIGELASIPKERKEEFRHAILRIKPAHTIALLQVQYDETLSIDDTLDPDSVILQDQEFIQ